MMSKEKYPDIIELKLKTCFSDAQKIDQMEKNILKKQDQSQAVSSSDQNDVRRVKKYIEISEEALNAIESGKYVMGTLHRDPETNKIVFNLWKSRIRKKSGDDRLVCLLPNGWVKESLQRIKLFISVKKAIGQRMIEVEMHRDMKTGMEALAKDRILAGESLNNNECATKQ